jgi:hypothetical protein
LALAWKCCPTCGKPQETPQKLTESQICANEARRRIEVQERWLAKRADIQDSDPRRTSRQSNLDWLRRILSVLESKEVSE